MIKCALKCSINIKILQIKPINNYKISKYWNILKYKIALKKTELKCILID